jgi:phosphoglycerate kinase
MASGLDHVKMITDFDLKDKRVFIRLDLNVPMDDGKISDDNRIQGALPTIRHAVQAGAKVVLASHFGRPKSKEDRQKFSLEPVARRLNELLDLEVILVDDPESDAPKGLLPTLRPNQILLLENLRFADGEEKNSAEFASEMADYTDIYINDAFGASHRAHASIVALPGLVKSKGMGFLMKKEIEMLDQLLYKTPQPFIAILGGSKVSDKIGVIENLMDRIGLHVPGRAEYPGRQLAYRGRQSSPCRGTHQAHSRTR